MNKLRTLYYTIAIFAITASFLLISCKKNDSGLGIPEHKLTASEIIEMRDAFPMIKKEQDGGYYLTFKGEKFILGSFIGRSEEEKWSDKKTYITYYYYFFRTDRSHYIVGVISSFRGNSSLKPFMRIDRSLSEMRERNKEYIPDKNATELDYVSNYYMRWKKEGREWDTEIEVLVHYDY